MTRWPRLSTSASRSMAMKVSSSMIRTSVAISAASSRPDSSTRLRSVGRSTLQDLRRVLLGEAFQRHQQEGLPRARGELGEVLSGGRLGCRAGVGLAVHGDRIPDLGEQAIERHPLDCRSNSRDFGSGDQGFQRGGHIGVAGGLAAGQRAGIAAQKRQMLNYGLRGRHGTPSPSTATQKLMARTPPRQRKFQK